MRPSRQPSGLTVIEVLVAAALFATSVMVLLGVFPVSARAVRMSQENTIATQLAANYLELARATSYPAIPTLPQINGPREVVVYHNGTEIKTTYTVNIQVADVPDPVGGGSIRGLKRVTAEIQWEGDRGPRKLKLETQVADTLP